MIFCLKVVAPQCILHRKEKVSGTIIWYCSIVHRPVTAWQHNIGDKLPLCFVGGLWYMSICKDKWSPFYVSLASALYSLGPYSHPNQPSQNDFKPTDEIHRWNAEQESGKSWNFLSVSYFWRPTSDSLSWESPERTWGEWGKHTIDAGNQRTRLEYKKNSSK